MIVGNCVVDADADLPRRRRREPRRSRRSRRRSSRIPASVRTASTEPSDDTGGDANVSLWGGVVINGNAPTNTTAARRPRPSTIAAATIVEGPHRSGLPGGVLRPTAASCRTTARGSSGTSRCAIPATRSALSNELNGFTLAGVGDGTVFDHNEVYANFDDGFEWFGGTVNTHHLMVSYVGDDGFDTDQGYTRSRSSSAFRSPATSTSATATRCRLRAPGRRAASTAPSRATRSTRADGDDCAGDCNLGSGRDVDLLARGSGPPNAPGSDADVGALSSTT